MSSPITHLSTEGHRADIAALAIHLMTNTAVTNATFDIDGAQQLV